jgi:hypothetical protein
VFVGDAHPSGCATGVRQTDDCSAVTHCRSMLLDHRSSLVPILDLLGSSQSIVFVGDAHPSGCATGVRQKRERELTTHGHQESGRVMTDDCSAVTHCRSMLLDHRSSLVPILDLLGSSQFGDGSKISFLVLPRSRRGYLPTSNAGTRDVDAVKSASTSRVPAFDVGR